MEKQIMVSSELYARLASHAKGFDTPTNVIERILDFYEAYQKCSDEKEFEKPKGNSAVTSYSIEVAFFPGGEEVFKKALLEKKLAWVKLYKTDGTSVVKLWKAHDFKEESDLMGNLRSGYLRGWRHKGICRAELAIDKSDLD